MRGPLTAARLLTLFFFLLLVSICAYWVVQILAPRPAVAPGASIGDSSAPSNLEPATRLFGAVGAVVAAPEQTNIQVFGVAEAGPNGVVILSIDGKPGVPYAVNEPIADGTLVKSVGLDKVVIEQRGRLIELKTPQRASQEVLSSGAGKPRTPSAASTAPPVPTRPAPPPPPPPPQQAPQSPQVEETLRQQQMLQQQQQQQQQQVQQQQMQQQVPTDQAYQGQPQGGQPPEGLQQQMQGQAGAPRFQPAPPAPRNLPGGSQPVPGGQPGQPGQQMQGGGTAVSGQSQVAPLR